MTGVDLPELPPTLPTFVFLHPGDENYARLRGAAFFDTIRHTGFKVAVSDGTGSAAIPGRGPLMVFAAVTAAPQGAEFLCEEARRPGSCVLVDVCGPIWAPDQLLGDDEVREYWARPGNADQARRLLCAVNGVTTPHASYTEVLMGYNPNVFVIPDLVADEAGCDCDPADDGDDEDDGHDCGGALHDCGEALQRFSLALMSAWHTAALVKAQGGS
jgi:hypothetical protein